MILMIAIAKNSSRLSGDLAEHRREKKLLPTELATIESAVKNERLTLLLQILGAILQIGYELPEVAHVTTVNFLAARVIPV